MKTANIYTGLTPLGMPQEYRASTWFQLAGTQILAHGAGPIDQGLQAGAAVIDASGKYIAPGLVDIHCHGGAGFSFEDTEEVEKALSVHRQQGTLYSIASLVTNPLREISETLASLAELCQKYSHPSDSRSALIGIHAEGPFLSPLHKGAHRPEFLKAPTLEDAARLYDAAGGWLKQITLAPEQDENLAVTRYLVERGVAVAVGHTDANYEQAKAAFDTGASILTHTFNAMNPLHHRAPGPIAAALDSEHVTLEVICDGVHVHQPMIRMIFDAAADRIALITDAMAATGCADGNYKLGTLDVRVKDSVARLAEGGAIAGSTLTLGTAVHRAIDFGVSPAQVIAAARDIPQRAIGFQAPQGEYVIF